MLNRWKKKAYVQDTYKAIKTSLRRLFNNCVTLAYEGDEEAMKAKLALVQTEYKKIPKFSELLKIEHPVLKKTVVSCAYTNLVYHAIFDNKIIKLKHALILQLVYCFRLI